MPFQLVSNYQPRGDQAAAIERFVDGSCGGFPITLY